MPRILTEQEIREWRSWAVSFGPGRIVAALDSHEALRARTQEAERLLARFEADAGADAMLLSDVHEFLHFKAAGDTEPPEGT